MRSGVRSPSAPQGLGVPRWELAHTGGRRRPWKASFALQGPGVRRWELAPWWRPADGPFHPKRPRTSGEHRVHPDLPWDNRGRRVDDLALLRSVLLADRQALVRRTSYARTRSNRAQKAHPSYSAALAVACRAAPFADDSASLADSQAVGIVIASVTVLLTDRYAKECRCFAARS